MYEEINKFKFRTIGIIGGTKFSYGSSTDVYIVIDLA
eukprot:SAG31_NODE_19102_length_612_cov_0.908382_1_plen_36_part_10